MLSVIMIPIEGIAEPTSSIKAASEAEKASIIENLKKRANIWWNGLWKNAKERDEAYRAAKSGGGQIKMPMFKGINDKSITQKLIAGEKVLYFGWKGGNSPYKVTISGTGKNEFSFSKETKDETNSIEIVLPEALKVGYYTVKVVASANENKTTQNDVQGKFEVVESFADDNIVSEIEAVDNEPLLSAIVLLTYGKSQWKFEAYQRAMKANSKQKWREETKLALETGRSTYKLER